MTSSVVLLGARLRWAKADSPDSTIPNLDLLKNPFYPIRR